MADIMEILHRELVYLWYYFTVQLEQIFLWWVLGMVIGSAISVFAKDKLHHLFGTLSRLRLEGNQRFRILLAHEPQFFSTYAKSGVDLALSGHTHGGQFRIPLIGAVYCPDQGFFAKYQSGVYTEGDTTMYLSRGLGSSTIPFRAFCRGELVFITLKAK